MSLQRPEYGAPIRIICASITKVLGTLWTQQISGITRLVYTSTPSVVHGGKSLTGIDESTPYPELDEFLSPYPRSKSLAERHVLKAHGPNLATVALRPHLIWGPGDNHLIPRLIDRAEKGRLFLVGDGTNMVDSVFVDNAADAHLLALDQLSPTAACGGKAYFITQGEPMPMKELINAMLGAAGLPPCEKHISVGLAKFAGATLEMAHKVFAPSVEPRMTRFLASQLATDHYYSIEAAKQDLDYQPALSFAEGIDRLKVIWSQNTVMPETSPPVGTLSPFIQAVEGDSPFDAFLEAVMERELELYPAQEEAILEWYDGSRLSRDTYGFGKS